MALSCLSSLINTSDLNTLLRSGMLTKLRLGATYLLYAKTTEEQNHSEQNDPLRRKKEANYKTNSRVEKPKPRVLHLEFPPGLGSEDHHAIHPR